MAPQARPTLHILCGKAASGKSTLATRLSEAPGVIAISEDDWLATLFGEEMSSLRDYVRYSARLEQAMDPHIRALLANGLSVVLDFQANTPTRRAWMRGLIDATGAAHRLHFLDVPDEICKARLRARNADASHAFSLSEAEFDQLSDYFVPPRPEEGFTIIRHGAHG